MLDSNSQLPPLNTDHIAQWVAPVSRWCVWSPDTEDSETPDIQFVDAGLRRKLSALAKISLHIAHACASDIKNVRIVYASRHGDITRTTSILTDLADGEAPSPTAFSMSVLNATAGTYSIATQDTSPATAVSAAASSFGFGLLEACMQLQSHPDSSVLLIYADEAPPAFYNTIESSHKPQAIGVLLTSDADTKVYCSMRQTNDLDSQTSQSDSFLNCIINNKMTSWHGEGRAWHWENRAK